MISSQLIAFSYGEKLNFTQILHAPWSRGLLEKLTSFRLIKKFPAFLGTEGSLPHSQVPANCPYPEPAQSSSHPHISLPGRSILILSSHLRLGFPSGLLTSVFPTKTLYTHHAIPHTCYVPLPPHSSQFDHPKNLMNNFYRGHPVGFVNLNTDR